MGSFALSESMRMEANRLKNLEESCGFFARPNTSAICHHALAYLFFLFYSSESVEWPHILTDICYTFNSFTGAVYSITIILIY